MDWRSRSNSAFATLWRERGLASGPVHAKLYDQRRSTIELPPVVLGAATDGTGPLAKKTLQNVYSFGAMYGRIIAGLFEVPEAEATLRADWCGRFNLGVSLFDWLCDEAGRLEDLLSMPPFSTLAGHTPEGAPPAPADAPEALLRELATELLAELEADIGPPSPGGNSLWCDLSAMLSAEADMARARVSPTPDLDAWLASARQKSAGPFRFMAQQVTLSNETARASAAELGDALGNGYWLVDDARDLWEDLDAGHWNLFLMAAAKTEAELLNYLVDPVFEFRLGQILLRPGWVEEVIAPVLDQIAEQMEKIDIAPETRTSATGLIATSMQRWLN